MQQPRSAQMRIVSVLTGWLLIAGGVHRGSAATQACDDFNPCTRTDRGAADGSCTGTAQPDGMACDDGNPCTINDRCEAGQCTGDVAADDTPCTSPLGLCVTHPHCRFGFCFGDFIQCPDD